MSAKTKKQAKYIFVTGGVVSGLGKGITSASLGKILSSRGFSVVIKKCDPYLNTDAGTLNPAEHGEVFVTTDGAETDLDLGHYERFIDTELTKTSSIIAGQIFSQVIANEREGKYLGKTVQIIPHVTNEIIRRITQDAEKYDIHIVEIGGTVGDYEAMAFIEAIRQMKRLVGERNVLYAHLVYLPYLPTSKEVKTKPAQSSVRDLREAGISADILFVRSDVGLGTDILDKLSLYCDVPPEAIVHLPTVKTVYEVPLLMEASNICTFITSAFKLKNVKPKMTEWQNLVSAIGQPKPTIAVGMVAKYLANLDTYLSVSEALKAAGWAQGVQINITWIDSENHEYMHADLQKVDGILVPGGFGSRGIEGKILAADFARDTKKPYLGLCLGMQTAVIAFARNVLKTQNVHSTEMNSNTKHPVIHIMPELIDKQLGGTMRLGNYACQLKTNSLAHKLYKSKSIVERHRHRYEFNNAYRASLEKNGLTFSGLSPDGKLVEIIELRSHPFYIASQFHPEFKSRPDNAHPLFNGFVAACMASTKKEARAASHMLQESYS